ncbi:hypothetical protein LIER_06166 [Lithospermum erythrorhizon]|uniref:Uncharacterized protein n=1 Tax=Lithospermum erythrorhizon TaxID=34254 RepID=A0AAV3P518_LITER
MYKRLLSLPKTALSPPLTVPLAGSPTMVAGPEVAVLLQETTIVLTYQAGPCPLHGANDNNGKHNLVPIQLQTAPQGPDSLSSSTISMDSPICLSPFHINILSHSRPTSQQRNNGTARTSGTT